MAELAFGAVRSLLALLREEAQQLTRVGDDVRFIQEEMQSMASFLQHLAETAPPGGEHRPPVRTWMKQVRDVALDCSNCVDLYVRKGRGRLGGGGGGGLTGFLRSLPCSVSCGTAVVARYDASDQIKLLKDRVREVSERRHRYGVELPRLEENNNDRPQAPVLQQPTFIIPLPVPKMSDGKHDGHVSGGTKEAASSAAIDDGSKDARSSGGREPAGSPSQTPGGYNMAKKNDQKQQLAFTIQLSTPKMTDGGADPVSGRMKVAVSAATDGSSKESKDAGSGGREPAGSSSQAADDNDGGDRKSGDAAKNDDDNKQQLTFTITTVPESGGTTEIAWSTTQSAGNKEADQDHITAVSDDFIRATLGFSEPNILEENTKTLVNLLTSHLHHGSMGGNPPTPLDNVIYVVAPNNKERGDLVHQVLGHRSVAMEFKKMVRPELDWVFLSSAQPQHCLWHILRFLLDNLLPEKEPHEASTEKDKWDEAKIAEEIGKGLKGAKSLFVIEGDVVTVHFWGLIKEALGKFSCSPGSAVIVVVTNRANADKLRHQEGPNNTTTIWPLVTHSLVDYWHTKALAVLDRSGLKTGYLRQNMRHILHQIKKSCEPHPFCIKMFVHYLCATANPSRSKDELDKLLVKTLVPTGSLPPDGSSASEIRESNGRRLLKFCYRDLPREYRSCLLYLAIFPPGRTIWRSRIINRWIVEGLITGRDMRRALHKAERCFDTLVNRGFVRPGDIGAARKVKSCTLHHRLIQRLVSDGAKDEQFLHPRLSSHLAQHFSVHGDLQLRRSDTIQDFMLTLGKKSRSSNSSIVYQPQLSLIKVLDLEECKYLKLKNPASEKEDSKNMLLCLNNICSNLLLLKYLSIRNTDVKSLPKKINNLLHLEILDIRQTKVPSDGTKDIMLPKLKCLLAGHTQTATTGMAEKPVPSVQVPSKISTMPNMEVLSHVNTSHDADVLKHIGHLWQLRKLGVVIDDDVKDWLKAIGDLNECLRSLSIHINKQNPSYVAEAANEEQHRNPDTSFHLKLLERLSVSGRTCSELLPLFFKDDHHRLISKVTLRDTLLDNSSLEAHIKKLSSLQCIKLRYNSYTERKLTINSHVLPKLKFLIVECEKITRIKFQANAAPKLEKIVWSFAKMESLSGILNLPILREVVLKGNESAALVEVRRDIKAHPSFITLIVSPPQN